MRHTMIHTQNKAWCSILPTGGNINYTMACNTHLLYMGNNIFGLMTPKPALTPNIQPTFVGSSLNPALMNSLPSPAVHSMALTLPTHPAPTPLFNNPLKPAASASLGAPPTANTDSIPEMNGNNESDNFTGNTNGNNKTLTLINDSKQEDDSISTVSTITNQDKQDGVTRVLDPDVLNKECKVSLTKLSEAELKKYLHTEKQLVEDLPSDYFDSTDDVPLSQLVKIPSSNSDVSESRNDRG